jgi:hypothetical protein
MPNRVVEKVRALPWLSGEEIDRIVSYRAPWAGEEARAATIAPQ